MKQQSKIVPDRQDQVIPSDLLVRLLKLPQVIQATTLKRSTVYKMIGDGTFPPPIKLGLRSVAWDRSAVEKWINDRLAATGQGGGHGNV